MSAPVTVALIDGPLPPDHPALHERIELGPSGPPEGLAQRHATAMATAMLANASGLRLVNLSVFGPRLSTDVATVVRALRLAAARQAEIIHCSLGLARRDPHMAAAVQALLQQGRFVVAAAAARGGPVFPAALPGVVAVQGDARCAPNAWSWLKLPMAEFGACPSLAAGVPVGGASVAAAHLTGHLARLLATGIGDPRAALRSTAAYVGAERRRRPMTSAGM